MLAKVAKVTDLSFVQGSKLWEPQRSGNYEDDCAMGRLYAQELIRYMRLNDSPHIFGHVSRAMAAAKRFDGVEVGFCSEIGITIVSCETAIATAVSCGVPEIAAF